MEYLNSIDDKLQFTDDSNYEYIDIFENPQFIYGNIDFSEYNLNFCKVPLVVQNESKKYGEIAVREMNNLHASPCGNRLRFFTDSDKIIFKVKLKRKWGYQKMVNWNALGFDVYNIVGEDYKPLCVFAPKDGFNIFSEIIKTPDNGRICVFLPSYNVIEEFKVGIERGSDFLEMDYYPIEKRVPIIFYGNSITQGTAASRSGNTFPNIVSKKLNHDIINLSISTGCRGSLHMADLIGKINCSAIIIDYTRNADSPKDFEETYEKFYRRIRFFHPFEKIILMTSSNFNNWKIYNQYDPIVIKTYLNAIKRGENTELLNQKELFEEEEFDYVTIDGSHYTDYGMFKIANEIIDLLNSFNSIENNGCAEFYDNATKGNKCEWWFDNLNNTNVFTDDSGTILSNNTEVTAFYLPNKINEVLGWTNSFKWEAPFILDVDILEYHNDCSFRIAENTGGEYEVFFKDLGMTNNNHITLINDGLSFEFYCDGVHVPDASIKRKSLLCQCGFRIVNGSLKYKNFIIH